MSKARIRVGEETIKFQQSISCNPYRHSQPSQIVLGLRGGDEPCGAEFGLRTVHCKGGAPVGRKLNTKIAKALIIKLKSLPQDGGEHRCGEDAGVRDHP